MQGRATREAAYGVDVQPLVGNDLCYGLNLACLQSAAQHGEYGAVLALAAHPGIVFGLADGGKVYGHAQFAGLEQHVLHHLSRVCLIDINHDAQRQGVVDVGLANVHHIGIVAGQNLHEAGGEPRAVLARDA